MKRRRTPTTCRVKTRGQSNKKKNKNFVITRRHPGGNKKSPDRVTEVKKAWFISKRRKERRWAKREGKSRANLLSS